MLGHCLEKPNAVLPGPIGHQAASARRAPALCVFPASFQLPSNPWQRGGYPVLIPLFLGPLKHGVSSCPPWVLPLGYRTPSSTEAPEQLHLFLAENTLTRWVLRRGLKMLNVTIMVQRLPLLLMIPLANPPGMLPPPAAPRMATRGQPSRPPPRLPLAAQPVLPRPRPRTTTLPREI